MKGEDGDLFFSIGVRSERPRHTRTYRWWRLSSSSETLRSSHIIDCMQVPKVRKMIGDEPLSKEPEVCVDMGARKSSPLVVSAMSAMWPVPPDRESSMDAVQARARKAWEIFRYPF